VASEVAIRNYASFRLSGNELDPERITRLVGVEPWHAHSQGDPSSTAAAARVYPTGVWVVSSQGSVDEWASLDDHISFLLDLLAPVTAEVNAEIRRNDLTADFFCYVQIQSGAGPVISHPVLSRLAELSASLSLDFYANGGPDAGQESQRP
jgi:hypothetical protein